MNYFDSARSLRRGMVVLAVLLLGGCATVAEQERTPEPQPAVERPDHRADDGEISLYDDDDEAEDEGTFDETEFFLGTGVFIDDGAARPRGEPPGDDGEITLNFEGQGIQEVVHAILGHMFQENYVIAPGVSGEVTFATARPLTRDQIMPVLEMLLRWNNATLIWREGRYHVVPVSEAVRGNLVPRTDALERGRGYEVMAVPLQYIAPAKMAEILEPYAREDGIFNVDNARGLLFLAGTQHELRNYMQIVETFDVDWLAGMSVGIFDLRRIEPDELLPELEAVFGEGGETPLSGMFRFMPLERLNAIMVITPNEDYLREAERWIRRLDRSSPEAGSRLYVYRVKNLEADVLAGYLGDLFGTGTTRQPRDRERRGGLAPGMEPARASSVGDFQREQRERRETRDDQPRTTEGGMTLGEDDDVRITAVQETNSLLIQASPSKYDAILNAIERLDEEPLQVLIEAQIIEVTLTDSLRYGVNWFLSNAQPGSDDFPGFPGGGDGEDSPVFSSSRAGDRARAGSDGLLGTVTRRGMDRTFVTATINMLETMSDVRTLSTPSLMVRNNSEASINVGRQVPVQSTSFTGTTDRVIGSFQYINTGVILNVTPRVNPGGLVYLQVDQEVSSPGDAPGEGSNPPVDTRQVSTDVAVQSGQTVMLGGLIREINSSRREGLPGLSRIPVLGGLFGARRESVDRTETLVLITPTVLESTNELEEVSREFQRRFRGVDPLDLDH
ncbi:type II secretion system secretin GspD [Wenzhouxiangella sp. AB-CW3]|uniref:type II secretion system secretin GspD n=1 Tax=Wenzhouxiangella sp. AB-CW3 TaxID=2771012 RepID=UPI00168AB51F|nr:type II secretion system secretin GspD [Wenzhouxiangella sp. AB-CW3]QOC23050.1 type II secretion system secretin GspD [Wenzhouxiangella sp. AB-CW3]